MPCQLFGDINFVSLSHNRQVYIMIGFPKEKIDRRKQRTRQALREALMALIAEKGFDQVNVHDIADRANINRATFYLHYRDKEELLLRSMDEIYTDLAMHIEQIGRSKGAYEVGEELPIFQHVQAHAAFYEIMLSERGVASFTTYVIDTIAAFVIKSLEQMAVPDEYLRAPKEFIAYQFAGTLISVLRWWLKNGMQHTPEQMALWFGLACLFGAVAAPPPPASDGPQGLFPTSV
jgi:AcrR family transcriptional regulator